jgi:hypothetical protein
LKANPSSSSPPVARYGKKGVRHREFKRGFAPGTVLREFKRGEAPLL